MSLRARLTVAFVLVLTLPMIAVIALVNGAVRNELYDRTAAELRAEHASAPALYRSWQARASDLVRAAASGLSASGLDDAFRDQAAANRFASDARGSLSLLAVVTPDGSVLGIASAPPSLLPGSMARDPSTIVRERVASRAVLAEAVVASSGGSAGTLVGGFWVDQAFAAALAPSAPHALVLIDGVAVASTDPAVTAPVRPALKVDGAVLAAHLGGQAVLGVRGPIVQGVPDRSLSVLTYTPRTAATRAASRLATALWIVLAATVIVGAAIAWLLARAITRPIAAVSSAAQAIAHGSIGGTIDVDSPDEVGRLAAAFNEVMQSMQSRVAELEESRDQVRRSVERLGEALRSTHDITNLLSVVLETAVAAVQARAGAVYLLAPSRAELSLKVSRPAEGFPTDHRPLLGEGIVGTVAQTRRPVLVPSASESPPPAAWEPHEPTVIAAPIESETQLVGVLALYGRTVAQPFDSTDLEAVRSLARQAAVGVENVMLHQEAQRLSITDGLTSLWNYRFMNMRLAQEVERAIRFGRALSALVIDIDHFKQINDQFGHQRGDAILAELANRLVSETRPQVDIVARYGGEEFVLILPETPLEGGRVVAERVRSSIASSPFGAPDEEPVHVTVSIGLACFPEHGATPQTLVHAADQALYEAKGRGRNTVVSADELDAAPPAPVA